MNKRDYLKRIETLEKMFGNEYLGELFKHITNQYEAMQRLQGGQLDYFVEQLNSERKRTENFSDIRSLANDKLGYDCMRLLAVLTHPCQQCAEDPGAWHTRTAFCEHKH